ncbi:MAG: signal recognition particle-docking protein FtsY [Pseudomonadota bacterium]|nr:MAG: signal recognition particle-docking protein FtsY [Pseudomonadota bacterium]
MPTLLLVLLSAGPLAQAPAEPPTWWIWAGLAVLLAVVIALIFLLKGKAPEKPAKAPPPAEVAPPREAPPPSPPEAIPPPEAAPPEEELTAEELEARKKAEYQARKEARRLERERRRLEREEAERARLAELEEQRRREEEERRRQEEERRRRIEAEAGKTLMEGLGKTREGGFMARLAGLFGRGRAEIGPEVVAELEEILFTADIGVRTAMRLVERAQERVREARIADGAALREAIRADIEEILEKAQAKDPRRTLPGIGLPFEEKRPWVIMVVGVNGAGKTTTIGKLAAKFRLDGKRVLLGAADTFRAAATEQLEVWAERAEVPVVTGPEGSDPGAVAFDAVSRGVREEFDVVIVDTAGRLHTKSPLMEELKKVRRVMGKAREGAPDEILLVLDATMGQNAIQQARQFHEALGVTGIALTKLDGTAKGGVVIGIADEFQIPVRLVGVGESLADLRPFDPREYVTALFGREES